MGLTDVYFAYQRVNQLIEERLMKIMFQNLKENVRDSKTRFVPGPKKRELKTRLDESPRFSMKGVQVHSTSTALRWG